MMYFIIAVVLFVVLGVWAQRHESDRQEKLMKTAVDEGERAGREEGRSESDCPYGDGDDEPRTNVPAAIVMLKDRSENKSQHYWWILGYRHGYAQTFANTALPEFQAGREAGEGGEPSSISPWSSHSKVKEERISAANWLSGHRKGVENTERRENEKQLAALRSQANILKTSGVSADIGHSGSSAGQSGSWLDFDEAVGRIVSIYIAFPDHSLHGGDIKKELRQIGEKFDKQGGMKLMRAAHEEFSRRCKKFNVRDTTGYMSAPRSLEYHWNGIGIWQS